MIPNLVLDLQRGIRIMRYRLECKGHGSWVLCVCTQKLLLYVHLRQHRIIYEHVTKAMWLLLTYRNNCHPQANAILHYSYLLQL